MWQAGGTTGGGGGGYFNESSVGTPAAENKKVFKAQNVVPVTINQLVKCKANALKIGKTTEAHMITTVALLTASQIQSTSATYTLQDSTGTIQAVTFISKDDEQSAVPEYTLNRYYRVFGSFQTQHGNVNRIMMFKMKPMEKLNELTMHLLEVVYAKLKTEEAENLSENAAGMSVNQSMNTNQFGGNMNQFGGNMNQFGGNMSMQVDPHASANATVVSSLTQQQQLVYNVINKCTDSRGLEKSSIPAMLNNRINGKELDNLLEFLAGEGHIYTTVDDNTYRATDL